MTMSGRTQALLALTAVALAAGAVWYWLRPRPTLEPALALMRAGKAEQATARLRAYLKSEPNSPRGQLLLAQVLLERCDTVPGSEPALAREALEHVRQVRTRDKVLLAQAKLVEGKLCDRLSRFDETEAAWKEAVALDPILDAGWLLLALYEFQDRRREGRALAWQLYRVHPQPAGKRRALVELLRQEVHHPAAAGIISRLSPVVAVNPSDLSSTLALGLALAREGRAEEGLPRLRAAVEAHPENLEAWDALWTALEDAGQVESLSTLLKLAPAQAETAARRARHEGWLAQERGDWEAAAQSYRLALQSEPHDLKLAYRLSRVLQLGGHTEEAERIKHTTQEYDQARTELRHLYETHEQELLDGSPPPELYQQVADLCEHMGRRDEARAWHALVLREHPGNSLSLDAVERLK